MRVVGKKDLAKDCVPPAKCNMAFRSYVRCQIKQPPFRRTWPRWKESRDACRFELSLSSFQEHFSLLGIEKAWSSEGSVCGVKDGTRKTASGVGRFFFFWAAG